jgi:hypothetical protein
VLENDKWRYFDGEGNVISLFDEFDSVGRFTEGLAYAVKQNENGNKYGYINRQGEIIIPFEYDYASDFYNGAATVTIAKNGIALHSLIDKTGKSITWLKEYYVSSSRGLINQYGAEIVPPMFDWIEILDSNTCIVQVTDYGTWENSRVGILTLPTDATVRKPPLSERPITVYLDGVELDFDTEPAITGGRTMVPMRLIFERLGADISMTALLRLTFPQLLKMGVHLCRLGL